MTILPSLGVMLLALIALALPCVVALRLDPTRLRGRHEPALALHRARLAAIGTDRAAGLIAPEEHDAARVEIQRQLLAEAERGATADPAVRPGGRVWLIGGAVLIPLATLALYLVVGHPTLPSAPMAQRISESRDNPQAQRDAALLTELRARVAGLDPASPAGQQGYILLGQVEATQEHWTQAASAWRSALAGHFDPAIAVSAAEAQSRADGRVSRESADLFRRALAAAPADASWRALAQQRIVESETAPH